MTQANANAQADRQKTKQEVFADELRQRMADWDLGEDRAKLDTASPEEVMSIHASHVRRFARGELKTLAAPASDDFLAKPIRDMIAALARADASAQKLAKSDFGALPVEQQIAHVRAYFEEMAPVILNRISRCLEDLQKLAHRSITIATPDGARSGIAMAQLFVPLGRNTKAEELKIFASSI